MRPVLVAVALLVAGCTGSGAPPLGSEPPPTPVRSAPKVPLPPAGTASDVPLASAEPPPLPEDPAVQKARIVASFAGRRPHAWGQSIPGVITSVPANEHVLALTFDACGGPGGDDVDADLIALLRREQIASTLFLTKRWIAGQSRAAASLAAEPLFEIENHGNVHRPCSVTGRSAYDIRGTRDVAGAVDEIQRGALSIFELTGTAPRFYRPGTAYFDDVCLEIAGALGHRAAGFSVNADSGAGATRAQVKAALLKAKSGAIVLLHMNHPRGQTAEGLMDAVAPLRARGVKFVRLRDAIPK